MKKKYLFQFIWILSLAVVWACDPSVEDGLTAKGEPVTWNRTFGGSENDILFYAEQTVDGGYIASGTTYSYGAGGGDYWLVRTDAEGNELWNRTFGGAGQDESYWFDQTADGGIILSGMTDSFGAGGGDFWIIKTDSEGNAPAEPSR